MNNSVNKLPAKESMTVEFKSDRSGFPTDDLVAALICLANTEGGELWLGVEDDGMPSGLHASHNNLMDLPNLVASKTSPSLSVTVTKQVFAGIVVAKITVPKSNVLIATTDGVCLHRRLKHDETPECISVHNKECLRRVALYPAELRVRGAHYTQI